MKRAILLLLALFVSSSVFAATSEFRVLLDLDNDQTTGCTSNAFNGAELLIVTKLEMTAPAHVTSVTRSTCSGGSFGTPVEENPGGWGVAYNSTTGQGVLETAISISNLTMPVRIGYAIGSQPAVIAVYDGPHDRRRAIGRPASGPPITLDGNTSDWAGIPPIGTSANGTLFVLETSNMLFFRFDGRLVAGPQANADSFGARQGQTVTIFPPGVLANDVEPSGGAMTAALETQPTNGSVFMQADGSFTYSHNGSNALTDTFTYRASSAGGTSDPATVTMSVAQNQPPQAVADAYTTTEGGTLIVPAPGVLANDSDPDTPRSSWSVSVLTRPARGILTLNQDGSFTYIHDGSETLADTFRYAIRDGFSISTALVTITITPVNDPPTPVADSYTTPEDTPLTILPPGVLGNDTDPDGVGMTATLVTNGTNGNAALNANGGFTYTPNANFYGTDSFTYNASDAAATSITPGTVTITVTPVNDPPSFTAGPNVTVAEDSAAYSAPWATAISSGPNESDPLNFIVTNDANPLFSVQPAISPTGVLTFTPNPDAAGVANVTVVLGDGSAMTPAVFFTITITSINDVPSFTKGADQVVPDTAGAQTVAGWATNLSPGPANESAQTLSFIVSNNNNAIFSAQPAVLPNGTLTFTPAVGQSGIATVSVQVQDNGGVANGGIDTSAAQTFTITIQIAPAFTSGNAATFTIGVASTFSVTTTGLPTAAITETGALPAGITLVDNGDGTATLGGTAGAGTSGTYNITINATNSVGTTPQPFTITVVCPTITVTNPGVTTGVASAPFSQTFTQSGGVGAMTFTTASTLPNGLTLATSGLLSGTPVQTGAFPIVVTATDSNGCTGTGPTYILVIGCQTITVTNPANTSGTASSPFSETFTQTGAIASATFTTASTLPAGLTLASNGVLSGTPTQTGSFPIVVTVTDGNGCTGTSATYNLVIGCQTITVTNPANATGPAGTPFSETFTQTGAIGSATFTTASTLPVGLTLAANGVLSGTPGQGGTFPIVVTVTDANGCTGTSATYNLVITCPVITVTNPANSNGTAGSPFSETFTQIGGVGATTFSTASTLPAGLTLAANGVLSGTPTQTGSFPIVVTATDSNGCTGDGATYTLVIGCQTITVNNPANTNATANSAFSETFTETSGIGTPTFTTSSTLPAGLTLATNGVLSGTPTETGSFPIVVTVTDGNGCTGTGATYTLVVACQVITVNNPANANGTANAAFSETFTATNAIGTTTFTTASTLPAGLSLATNGVLSGTPTQTGTFPIVVTATDANGCTGTGATYNLVIGCQTITVTNPANANGTVSSPFSETFTQTGAIGGATFTTASTLPAGLTLATNGVLSGTPTQAGLFPIVVTVTDGNGCTGTSATYNLVIGCQTITVTNPVNATGPAGTPFSETFTQTGAIGTATFTTASTLPTGLTLSTAGVLSGTPTQGGTFPIVVTVTDSNGCTGTGATYNLVITCPVITVTNPVNTNGTANSAFSETFTQSGGNGATTFSTTSTLPAGLTLASNGVLSGTPTQTGSFPIIVTATDSNGCTGTGATYTLVIACQIITVNNPANANGTANSPFSETFTATNAIGATTFTTSSTLPAGLTLAADGTLSGTPMVIGSFPIVVNVTDGNGCTGTGATYTLVIGCQVITVNNPANTTGTLGAPFSETFTATNAIGAVTFTTASTLPNGLTLATDGTLSGTPTEPGTFPIVVTATDANGCMGTSATYNLVINCQTITVTNPANSNGTVGTPFSEQFTETGSIGGATFTTASTLPAGITLSTAGLLSGTPTQAGSFPIVVTATDGNGCTGNGPTYTLIIACNVITVTNPANENGTANSPFSETFTQTGGNGAVTFTTASTLPTGLTLSTAGVLSGTPLQTGTFPIVVTATDVNGCTGNSATYNLVIACQTITVNNPGVNTGTRGTAFSQTFTATNTIGATTFTTASTLPAGLLLSSGGVLSGTPTQIGTFPIVVTATDSNGCIGTGATYNLVIACNVITVTNPGVSTGIFNVPFSQTFTQSGAIGGATFTTASTLPTGLSLSTAGVLSGTPTQTGTFPIVVTVTDGGPCTGNSATYNLSIAPVAANDSFSNLVDNTQGAVIGGMTTSPTTPFVSFAFAGRLIANDLPAGGVAATSGTFGTTAGGSVTIATDGTYLYTPQAHPTLAAITVDTFTYTVVSNGVTSAPGTVTLNLANRVWYVKNNSPAGGNGQSQTPFDTLVEAQTASTANDIIFVYNGNSTNSGQNAGISLKSGQTLWGEAVPLVVNLQNLVAAGSRPTIGNSAGVGVTVDASAASLTNVLMKAFSVAGTTQAVNILSAAANTLSATVDNIIVNSATNNGIRVSAASSGTSTVTIQNNLVSAATQNGLDLRTAAGAGALLLDVNSNSITASGIGMVIDGSAAGTATITNFANNTVTGNTVGSGISVNTATFDVTPGNPFNVVSGGNTISGTGGNGVGGSGMLLTNVKGDLSFTDLEIVNDNGAGLLASAAAAFNTGTGTGFQITASGNNGNIASTAGPAVDLNTVTANLVLNSIASTNSAGNGVSLVTVPGTFSAGSGSSITNATATDFLINGSNATVTYDGSITDDVGQLVNITNTTGGAKTFSGAITDGDDSDGSGVSLTTNTGATITFRGGLVLSTGANPAFTATGGGTINVCDENPCNPGATGLLINKLTTTTGTAVNVANTNIGSNSLEFRSISVNGAANGIVLNNTGNTGGNFRVAGTGSSGTGGTIQNTTGVGILLTTTRNIFLSSMNIQNSGDDGIRGQGVTNFDLIGCTLSTNGNATAENGLQFGEASGSVAGITGTLNITNTNITASAGNNVHIRNTSGTLTAMNVTGGSFNNLNDITGANSFLFETSDSAVTTAATISGATFNNNSPQRALEVQAHSTGSITDFVVTGCTFNANGIHASFTQDGSANIEFRFLNNNVTTPNTADNVLQAVNVFSSSQSTGGTIVGTISGNTIATNQEQISGIETVIQGRADATLLIDSNNVSGAGPFGNRGISVAFRGPTAVLGPQVTNDVTITNNQVDNVTGQPGLGTTFFPLAALSIEADNQSGSFGTAPIVRADIRGNTVPATAAFDLTSGNVQYYEYDGDGTPNEFQDGVGELVDTAPASANANAQLSSTNTGSVSSFGITLIPGPINLPPP